MSAADRDGLLAAAEALVFPSEYEGFGAPVLEAMALGTPVICSDRTALPEVAGDAALVLPLELDAWKGALDEVAARRDELSRPAWRAPPSSPRRRRAAPWPAAYRLTAATGEGRSRRTRADG